jgi:hypothetical protein
LVLVNGALSVLSLLPAVCVLEPVSELVLLAVVVEPVVASPAMVVVMLVVLSVEEESELELVLELELELDPGSEDWTAKVEVSVVVVVEPSESVVVTVFKVPGAVVVVVKLEPSESVVVKIMGMTPTGVSLPSEPVVEAVLVLVLVSTLPPSVVVYVVVSMETDTDMLGAADSVMVTTSVVTVARLLAWDSAFARAPGEIGVPASIQARVSGSRRRETSMLLSQAPLIQRTTTRG